jgi:hypothetical protein
MGEGHRPGGAAYSAPTELGSFGNLIFYKDVSPTGFPPVSSLIEQRSARSGQAEKRIEKSGRVYLRKKSVSENPASRDRRAVTGEP